MRNPVDTAEDNFEGRAKTYSRRSSEDFRNRLERLVLDLLAFGEPVLASFVASEVVQCENSWYALVPSASEGFAQSLFVLVPVELIRRCQKTQHRAESSKSVHRDWAGNSGPAAIPNLPCWPRGFLEREGVNQEVKVTALASLGVYGKDDWNGMSRGE